MAVQDHFRPLAGGRRLGGRPFSLATALIARLAAWNDARRTRRALDRLSDRELDDIGLTRADIARVSRPERRF